MSNEIIASPGMLRRFKKAVSRYWFVWIPGILFNTVLTIDHIVAQQNEKAFTVTLKEAAFANTAGQEDERLSDTLRAHWITTNEDGDLEGRISAIDALQSKAIPIDQLDVVLLQKGEKVHTASTDEEGRFLLEDVEAGVYTLVAAGRNGFLAYGVNVLPSLEEFDVLELNTKSDPAAAKRAYYVSHFKLPPDAVIREELQIDAAAVPPEFSTLKRISQNYLPSASALSIARDMDDMQATELAENLRGGFQFPLDENGNFNGRIQLIATEDGEPGKLTDLNIFLIQDDVEMARVAVEENGSFTVEDVDPGIYSMVAAGEDGFAALSLELVSAEQEGADQVGRLDAQGNHFVSHRPKVKQVHVTAIDPDPRNRDATIRFMKEKKVFAPDRFQANRFGDGGLQQQSFSGGQLAGSPGGSFAPSPVGPTPIPYPNAPTVSAGGASSGAGFGRGLLLPLVAAGVGLGTSLSDNNNPRVVDPGVQSPNFEPSLQ